MSGRPHQPRGPIGEIVDWFLVDPVTTGFVVAPLVLFAVLMAYLAIRDALLAL